MKKHVFSLTIYSCFLVTISHAQSWLVTGNSGTNPGVNFIGTKDNNALVFKTNNIESMRLITSGNLGIGITAPVQKLDVNGNINIGKGFSLYMENYRVLRIDSLNRNTFLGNGTGAFITTGYQNTATGWKALFANKTGSYNTAYGVSALASNTAGNTNVATGAYALYSNNTGSSNTANGYATLYRNTSGSYNVSNGAAALYSNTIGADNIAVGASALQSNTTGNRNIANGKYALFSNISGADNIAVGTNSLYYNKDGNYNIATGADAIYNNVSGWSNIGIGNSALYLNTNGNANIGIGNRALYSNKSGGSNIAAGNNALYSNTEGGGNIACGIEALYTNTAGNDNIATGNYSLWFNTTGTENVANGFYALYGNNSGNYNVAVGSSALSVNNGGSRNTAVGSNTLQFTANSWYNTALGYNAGSASHNGWNNTFIGAEAAATYDDTYNSIAIGNAATVTTSNQVRIGNNVTSSIGGYTNWTNISDGRVKKNIKENVPGLAFIKKLKPITYNLDLDAADKIIQSSARKDKDGKMPTPLQIDVDARNAKQQIVYTGFAAQDVEKAAKELNYDFSGVDVAKNEKDLYGLRYAEFVVPLVKAVQELSKQNDEMKNEIKELKAALSQNNSGSLSALSSTNVTITDASLGQNIPNPFNRNTSISYTLPQKISSAQIIITDKNGTMLKQVNISGNRKGTVTIDAATLAAGAYNYSLVIDGRMISSKQMLLTK